MKKIDLIWSGIWSGLSLFVILCSIRLEIGSFLEPGPGLMPFLLGIVLLAISLIGIFLQFRSAPSHLKEVAVETVRRPGYLKSIFSILAALFGYTFVLDKLGYLITTLLVFFIIFKFIGSSSWRFSILATFVVTVGSYILFAFFLGIKFPPGIIRVG